MLDGVGECSVSVGGGSCVEWVCSVEWGGGWMV